MAGQQQAMIADTIRAMKLAMKRRPSDSDSDHDIKQHTNRGNKLKRNAKFVNRDRLDDTGGLAYKKRVNHAGYLRSTISVNPPLLDEDGDVYSPTSSDHEAERYGERAEEDPFANIQLERLLRPLTSASDLPNHPSLSVAYKSKGLTQMAEEALEMLRRERARLWKAKRLLQRFRGDSDWLPCSTFEAHDDEVLLVDGNELGYGIVPSPPNDETLAEYEGLSHEDSQNGANAESGDAEVSRFPDQDQGRNGYPENGEDFMQGIRTQDMLDKSHDHPQHNAAPMQESQQPAEGVHMSTAPKGNDEQPTVHDPTIRPEDHELAQNPTVADLAEREAHSETASQSNGTNTHGMTTRARARSPAERSDHTPSPSPSDSASAHVVNSWFIAPVASLADRNMGLPANEAEDTRKLLLLYVQKQEQIVRSLDTLHAGLQKADRLRQYVYHTCKAEAHVTDGKTDMSDGEDWYDIADWGLQQWELQDGKLEKGKDEVEDVEEERGRRPGRGRRVNRI